MRVLVTRPQPDADRTVGTLARDGILADAAPLTALVALDAHLPDPGRFDALALTSGNALLVLDDGALAPWRGKPVFAVGARTAAAARARGFEDIRHAEDGVEALARLIATSWVARVFYPAARTRAGDLEALLALRNIAVTALAVYDMAPVPWPEDTARCLVAGGYDAVLLYSRRATTLFLERYDALVLNADGAEGRNRLGVLCLSGQIAAPLRSAGFARVGIARAPNEDAMRALIRDFAQERPTSGEKDRP